jgi:hypothetical protein
MSKITCIIIEDEPARGKGFVRLYSPGALSRISGQLSKMRSLRTEYLRSNPADLLFLGHSLAEIKRHGFSKNAQEPACSNHYYSLSPVCLLKDSN